ncbi:DNA repair and recombination protein RadB [Candidatus Pacearchaeota archaeon CG_4_9_14_0_2_um_filter_39_13]|nr:DNA repair and recombination protein RadB [Candidatus Pacearchaeota archaeon]PJC44760.1 MAG: DNA repair and recombination protein RadB [Candidatus Pacearchaeota archaeon CG_4_9_14_0_2_um_filter_39_13]
MKLSAGSYDLNRWLHGGYESDIITTLYGGPGTGKTNFCLLAAVSQAKKGKKVIYVDTEGGFSSERVKQLVGEETDYKKVLENILILNPTNFDEQKKSFDELLKHLKNEVSLIIVDGMTMLYRLELASARETNNGEVQKVNSELARQMRILAEIARKRGIPVIATNQVYNWDGKMGMVGGDIMQYWSKCLIELTNDRGRRSAFLKKHRNLKEEVFNFQIWDGGIRRKGWL